MLEPDGLFWDDGRVIKRVLPVFLAGVAAAIPVAAAPGATTPPFPTGPTETFATGPGGPVGGTISVSSQSTATCRTKKHKRRAVCKLP